MVRGVGANGVRLRQGAVINDGRDLRIVGEEIVVEQIGERGAAVAELFKQRDRQCLKIQVRERGDPCRAKSKAIEHVEELREAFRISRVVLDGRGIQADDVEQGLMRIAGLADRGGALAHVCPVGIELAQQVVERQAGK